MPDLPELPQSISTDKAWGRLMHVVGRKVPRRLKNVDYARREFRNLQKRVR